MRLTVSLVFLIGLWSGTAKLLAAQDDGQNESRISANPEGDPSTLMDKGSNDTAGDWEDEESKWESFRRNITALIESLDDSLQEDYDQAMTTEGPTTTIGSPDATTAGKDLNNTWSEIDRTTKRSAATTTTTYHAAPKSLILSLQPAECVELRRLPSSASMAEFLAEPGVSLNISCLTRIPHEWSSNARGYDPNQQLKVK